MTNMMSLEDAKSKLSLRMDLASENEDKPSNQFANNNNNNRKNNIIVELPTSKPLSVYFQQKQQIPLPAPALAQSLVQVSQFPVGSILFSFSITIVRCCYHHFHWL